MTKLRFLVTSPTGIVTPDGVFYAGGTTIYETKYKVSQLIENGSIIESIGQTRPRQQNRTFVWRGDWQYGVTYALNDGVSFNGLGYIAVIQNLNKMPPSDQWRRIKI